MRVNKKVGFALVLFSILLTLPLALATTDITLRVGAKNSVTMNIINPNTGDASESHSGNANDDGIIEFISNITSGKLTLYIIARESGKIVDTARYENVSFGSTLSFDLNDAPVVETPVVPVTQPVTETPVANSSVETSPAEEVKTTSSEEKTNNPVSGSAIAENHKISKNMYYVIGVLFVVVVLGFVLSRTGAVSSFYSSAFGSKPSAGERKSVDEEVLANAERKIKEAQAEINRIRNQDKIKNFEKKVEEEKKRVELEREKLEKLKRGEEVDFE